MNVARTNENLKKCQCLSCPTFSMVCKIKGFPHDLMVMLKGDIEKTEHFEGMFCAFGNSKCIEEDKGCNCGKCLIMKENNLTGGTYCLKDTAN
jgi:hypothetical protein